MYCKSYPKIETSRQTHYGASSLNSCIKGAAIGTALAAIAAGSFVAVYYLCPGAHAWVNSHIFTPLSQMSMQQQLLAIGIPILGMGTLPLLIYAFNHRRPLHTTEPFPRWDTVRSPPVLISNYPANDRPYTDPRFKRAIAGLAVMTLLIVGTLIAAHGIHGLNTAHLHFEKSLLSIGLSASAVALMVNLAVMYAKARIKPIYPPKDEDGQPIYTGT